MSASSCWHAGSGNAYACNMLRGLARGELSGPVSVTILIGDRKISLTMSGYPTKHDPIDVGATFASTSGTLPLVAARAAGGRGGRRDRGIQSRRQESAACHQAVDRGAAARASRRWRRNARSPSSRPVGSKRHRKSRASLPRSGGSTSSRRALWRLPRPELGPGCRRTKEEMTARCLHGGGAQ